jgi:hypothetical protein
MLVEFVGLLPPFFDMRNAAMPLNALQYWLAGATCIAGILLVKKDSARSSVHGMDIRGDID